MDAVAAGHVGQGIGTATGVPAPQLRQTEAVFVAARRQLESCRVAGTATSARGLMLLALPQGEPPRREERDRNQEEGTEGKQTSDRKRVEGIQASLYCSCT